MKCKNLFHLFLSTFLNVGSRKFKSAPYVAHIIFPVVCAAVVPEATGRTKVHLTALHCQPQAYV